MAVWCLEFTSVVTDSEYRRISEVSRKVDDIRLMLGMRNKGQKGKRGIFHKGF